MPLRTWQFSLLVLICAMSSGCIYPFPIGLHIDNQLDEEFIIEVFTIDEPTAPPEETIAVGPHEYEAPTVRFYLPVTNPTLELVKFVVKRASNEEIVGQKSFENPLKNDQFSITIAEDDPANPDDGVQIIHYPSSVAVGEIPSALALLVEFLSSFVGRDGGL